MDNTYLMWLNRIDGIGNRKQALLLSCFGGAREIFTASRRELEAVDFLNEQLIHKILSAQDNKLLNMYEEQLEKTGMRFVPVSDAEYPERLRQIYEPPSGLYVVGRLPEPDIPTVGVIGSRKCTEYGLTVAYRLGNELAQNGVAVVSGMARGVDSMSHRGALEGGGFTAAVLGCGADVCYPPENQLLMRKIKETGCVISEYPPGTTPFPGFFPARNRIISGLSQIIVVVEAGKRSGTLITVDQALEEGREVMAVPGNITSKLSYGTNALIKNGAAPVTCCGDILVQLGLAAAEQDSNNENKNIALAPAEKLVYDCMSFEPVAIDEIFRKLDASVSEIYYILTVLELRKLIRRLPGQRFIKI